MGVEVLERRKEIQQIVFAALVPAQDGLHERQGDPHRGGQGLHRPEHCHIEGGDRSAPREFLAEAPRWEN